MKYIIGLIFLLFSLTSVSQSLKMDIYEVNECVFDSKDKLVCNIRDANFQAIINTDLNFIFILDKDSHNKILSVDIDGYEKITSYIWSYEVSSDGNNYIISYDERMQVITLFPLFSINSRNLRLSYIIFKIKNDTKI